MRRRAVGIALLALGIAACDIDTDDSQRTAFVEVTSSPSGLPVTIELNKTKREATTPVGQAMTYDGLCGSVSGEGDCVIFGSAEVKESDRGRTRGA